MSNQSEKCNDDPNLVLFNKIQKQVSLSVINLDLYYLIINNYFLIIMLLLYIINVPTNPNVKSLANSIMFRVINQTKSDCINIFQIYLETKDLPLASK